ncbi:unnamed protein product [Closterium sp. NIES-54]
MELLYCVRATICIWQEKVLYRVQYLDPESSVVTLSVRFVRQDPREAYQARKQDLSEELDEWPWERHREEYERRVERLTARQEPPPLTETISLVWTLKGSIYIVELYGGVGSDLAAALRAGCLIKKWIHVERDPVLRKMARHHVLLLAKEYPNQLWETAIPSETEGAVHDVRDITEWVLGEWGQVDLVIAGWECQGYSRAGEGMGIEDARGASFRDLKQVLEMIQKRQGGVLYVLENVDLAEDRRETVKRAFTEITEVLERGVPDDAAQLGSRVSHERRISLVMEVARTSMIHAPAPHFLWPFAVRYAVHQLNLWPRVSLRETSPTLRWIGKVGDASVFRVWGSRAFVRDSSADKLSARAIPCVFIGFSPDAPGWQFYHATSPRVFPSQNVTFDEPVSFYRLFPYRSAAPPPPPLFLAPGPPPVDPLPPQGPSPLGVYQEYPLPGIVPVEVALDSGAASGGAEPGGAEPGGAESEGAGSGGAESGGVEPVGVESVGAEPEGVKPDGAESGGTSSGGTVRPLLEVSRLTSTRPAPSPYIEQAGGLTECHEPASCFASPVRTGRRVPRPRPPPVPSTHAMEILPSSVPLRVPLPPPPESSLPAVPDPESDRTRAACPTVSCLLATVAGNPSFESTAVSALISQLVDFAAACRLDYATTLVAGSESASPPSIGGECALGTDVFEDRQEDFECLAAAIPRFASMPLAPERDPDAPDIPTPRSYVEAITGPYSSQWQAAMDAEMASWKSTSTYVDAIPLSQANTIDGMWIFRVKRPPGSLSTFNAHYVTRGFRQRQGVYYFQTFSPTPKMTTLQVLHEEISLRRPPGFTGLFLVAPSTADPSLFLRTDTSLRPFYILIYVDNLVFATSHTEVLALVKSELQKRHTCTDVGELRSYLGLQITRDRARPTTTLTQSHMVHQVLQRFGFQYSSPQSTPLLTSHSLSAPPSDESVEPSGLYPELVGCLMYLMTCTPPDLAYPLSILACYFALGRHRPEHWEAAKRVLRYLCSTSGMGLVLGGRGPVVLTGHADASWVDDSAMQRSTQGYTFSLGFGSVSWLSTRLSSVLSSSCEAEIYAGAMAAQELRWLTYLLTDLGDQPRSPLDLYIDNKDMIALCQEHRLDHRVATAWPASSCVQHC